MINNDAKLRVLAEVALNRDIPDDFANIVYALVKEGVGIGLFINGSIYVGVIILLANLGTCLSIQTDRNVHVEERAVAYYGWLERT